MIEATSLGVPYRTAFSNGTIEAVADVSTQKGGGGLGFGPHELLEAALATCVTMTVQMAAAKHAFPLEGAHCTARLDRSQPDRVRLHYTLSLDGPALTPEQVAALHAAAARCPVAQTLSVSIACCQSESSP
jgi:putative redox protein